MEKPSRSFFRLLLTYSFTAVLLTGLAFALLAAGATWAFAGSPSVDLSLPPLNSVSADQVFSEWFLIPAAAQNTRKIPPRIPPNAFAPVSGAESSTC